MDKMQYSEFLDKKKIELITTGIDDVPELNDLLFPFQKDIVAWALRRGLKMWSKEGDIVLSPFMGIGSEGYCSLEMGRKFVGFELKKSYFEQAARNLENIVHESENKLL
jgi:hypothetical protein